MSKIAMRVMYLGVALYSIFFYHEPQLWFIEGMMKAQKVNSSKNQPQFPR